MDQFIIAHDVGTSGNKAVLVSPDGRIHGKCSAPFHTHYPGACMAEQEPADWWKAIVETTRALLQQTSVAPSQILCVTHCTQLLGILPMSAKTGALGRAIIWLDGRADVQARRMMRKFIDARVFILFAGAPMCGKDCIPKLLWLKDEEPDRYRNMDCFLDVNGYLIYRSTGNMVMEWTAASTVGLDLKTKQWMKGVMKYVGLDPAKLPPLVKATDKVGELTKEAAGELGLLPGTPVIAGAGDAPCAAVGAGAVREGAGHICLGTSAWLAVVTSRRPKGKRGVATIHSADPDKTFLIAESETAGGCLEWAAKHLYSHHDGDPEDVFVAMDRIVRGVPAGSHGLIFTPWMYGERAPIADCNARSTFLNLSGLHSRRDMIRAVYEGVAYNIRWLVEIVSGEFGFPLSKLRVIGGGAKSATWMQMLADVTHRRIESVHDPKEAGAVGAALVAAVGLGIYPNFEALESVPKVERTLEPQPKNSAIYDQLFESFRDSYGRLRPMYKRLNEKLPGSTGFDEEVSQ